MPHQKVLALDIGGANIKLADGKGFAANYPFALWKHPNLLGEQISVCLAHAPPSKVLAVTMTGELSDCFETKAEGVCAIISAVLLAAKDREVWFYQTSGEFVSSSQARETPLSTAASNWHALASISARYSESGAGILIDIGSTTSDFIPLIGGKVAARGKIDPDRLLHGELVYTGIERSPVCGILSQLPWQGAMCPVANELFATAADAYLLLGAFSEQPTNTNSADGKPYSRPAAITRLARMICADREMVSEIDAVGFAEAIRDAQLDLLESAFLLVLDAMVEEPRTIVLSGHGEFLALHLLKRLNILPRVVSLTNEWGADASRSATAHALGVLANEHFQ